MARTLLGRAAAIAAACVAAWLGAPLAAQAAVYDAGFVEQEVVGGLTLPVGAAWAPDGRLFIAEKRGRVRMAMPGTGTAVEILNIESEVNDFGDRGLLGIAVDSQFASHPYLYVLYTHELSLTSPDDNGPMVSRLRRFRVAPDGTVSDDRVILGTDAAGPCAAQNDRDCIPSEGDSHSIGTVRSAPDGTLYVGSGDASGYGAVEQDAFRSYDERSLAGKVLHVDRDGFGLPGHRFCPGDGTLTHNCTKLFAKGFRNPFRFTVDGERLVLGDVGWTSREELDLVEAGRSYGWPCYEGPIRTPGYSDDPKCPPEYAKEGTPQAHSGPVWFIDREGQEGAMLGGPRYPGGAYPDEFDDAAFVADYVAGKVYSVPLAGGPARLFASDVLLTDLQLGPGGDLYYVSPGWSFGSEADGGVYRVSYSPQAGPPRARARAVSPTFGEGLPLRISFDASQSSDPNGQPLEYEWDFGDGSTAAGQQVDHAFDSEGVRTVKLTVTDPDGHKDLDTLTVHPGNAAPPDGLSLQATPSRYRGGGPLRLTGAASDGGAPLPAASLDWTVRLRHGSHVHPVRSWQDVDRVEFTAAGDHDADSHYEATLTATDAQGATSSQTFHIYPETSGLALRSDPPGAPLSYAGRVLRAPADLTAAIGFRTTISAAQSFSSGGREFRFRSWSDGGGRMHDVVIPPGGLSLLAAYDAVGGPHAAPAPGGGSGERPAPRPDDRPPRLVLPGMRGVDAARGVLRGRVSDPSGVRRVEIALALRAGARCRWWNARTRSLARGASCRRPRFVRARLQRVGNGRYRWRRDLQRSLTPGRWTLLLRAVDGAGNRASAAVGRPTRIAITVRNGRASIR